MSILKVKSIYDNLSKTELKIADYILENYGKIIYMPVTELAHECKAGETSIIRFCQKLGYKGFHDFKLSLAKENIDDNTHIHGNKIKGGNDIPSIVNQIKINNITAINNTASLLDFDNISIAAKKISKAAIVDIYGVGASSFTAGDLTYKLLRLGINVRNYSDNHLALMSASTLNRESVAIGISFSGCTKDTVDALKTAKGNNAYTIAITNHLRSPITNYAELSLFTSAEETPLRSGALTSKIAQLFILDILYTVIILNIKEKAYSYLDKTAKSVVERLY
jgi:RpiR family transcriptional regulator, carbohydrate utilization regulator